MFRNSFFEKIAAALWGVGATSTLAAITAAMYGIYGTGTNYTLSGWIFKAIAVPALIAAFAAGFGSLWCDHKATKLEDQRDEEIIQNKALSLARTMSEEELLSAQFQIQKICDYDDKDMGWDDSPSFRILYRKWGAAIEELTRLKKKGCSPRVEIIEGVETAIIQLAPGGCRGTSVEAALEYCEEQFSIAFKRNALLCSTLRAISEAIYLKQHGEKTTSTPMPEDRLEATEVAICLEIAQDYERRNLLEIGDLLGNNGTTTATETSVEPQTATATSTF